MSSCCRSRPASTPRTNCWQAPCRVWSASTTTVDLQSRGKDVKAIAVLCQVPGEVEMVSTKAAPTFKSMADAKGKTLGVTGLGSSTSFLTQYLALQHGVQSTQYTMLPVGADASFIAAIKQGRIDAGMTTEPTVSALEKMGDAKVLVDLRTLEGTRAALGGTYPAASLYVQSAWADSHKDQATKLAHAFAKTMQFIHTHSADEIAAKMPADYQKDKALYVSALKASLPMYGRRQDAGRWPGHRAEGAVGVQPVGEGQAHRPGAHLHERFREREVIELGSRAGGGDPAAVRPVPARLTGPAPPRCDALLTRRINAMNRKQSPRAHRRSSFATCRAASFRRKARPPSLCATSA